MSKPYEKRPQRKVAGSAKSRRYFVRMGKNGLPDIGFWTKIFWENMPVVSIGTNPAF